MTHIEGSDACVEGGGEQQHSAAGHIAAQVGGQRAAQRGEGQRRQVSEVQRVGKGEESLMKAQKGQPRLGSRGAVETLGKLH